MSATAENMPLDSSNMSFLEEVQAKLSQSSSFNSAKDFDNLIHNLKATAPANTDPRALDEVIQAYISRFDRLKFLFLEQEAKEQFLRLVLEQNTMEINKDAIEKAQAEAKLLQKTMYGKKSEVDDLMKHLTAKAGANHELIDEINYKTDIIKTKSENIANLQQQIQDVQRVLGSANKNDQSLSQLKSMDGDISALNNGCQLNLNSVKDLQVALNAVRSKRKTNESKKLELERLKSEREDKLMRDSKRSTQLMGESERLNRLIENIKKLEGEQDGVLNTQTQELLNKEEKLLILENIWKDYSQIQNLKFDDNVVKFNFKNSDVIIQMKLRQNDKRIESIYCYRLSNDFLQNTVTQANETKIPIHFATNALYDEIKKAT